MRDDVSPNKVILAVSKAIEATFDRGDWIELGILTDTPGRDPEPRSAAA